MTMVAAPAYATPGDLDQAFGSGGLVTTDFAAGDEAAGVAIQQDGKIVAAGSSCCGFLVGTDFAIARYNSNGTLDGSFGSCRPVAQDPLCASRTGKVTTDFGETVGSAASPSSNVDRAYGVVVQRDGKIVAAGRGNNNFALARYNSDGTLDTAFGSGGKVTTDISGTDEAFAMGIQPDGRLVVAGCANCGSIAADFGLARYNSNGTLDTTFGKAGKVTTSFGDFDQARDLAIQGDGKIVAVGRSGDNFALARYNPIGTLDTAFGTAGKTTTDFGGIDQARGVAIQPDGRIVAAGCNGCGASQSNLFALARYNPNGSLDQQFGNGGKLTSAFQGSANDVAIQPDGKILAAGTDTFAFILARYHTSGASDSIFGTEGTVRTNFGPANQRRDRANGVALQSDGKFVAAGSTHNLGGGTDFALARYLP